MPGLSAPEAWGSGAQAQWRAAHRAIDTGAVVPAVGLEGLAIGVAHAIQDAAHTDHLCTHSYCVPRAVPTVIAVEAPVWVTDGSLCAVVPELLGTYLTAFTAICDKADAQGAARWGLWALTRPLAELRACRRVLQWHWGESHGCGGCRDDRGQDVARHQGCHSCQRPGQEPPHAWKSAAQELPFSPEDADASPGSWARTGLAHQSSGEPSSAPRGGL